MRAYLILIAVFAACLTSPAWTNAQGGAKNAEARVYFEEGNRLVREANDASEADRDALLRRALEAYVDSLGIVRSRNALFNAAVTLEELGRHAESFNYYTEYLGIAGLSEADRREAEERRDALRSQVAVLALDSEPAGAEVRIDREDLAPLGRTPVEVAIAPGSHQVFLAKAGFVSASESVTVAIGERSETTMRIEPTRDPMAEPPPAAHKPNMRLRNAAIGTAASTLATAAVGLGLSLKARSLHDDYDRAADAYEMTGNEQDLADANRLANRTDRFNIAADVMWGTTAALGISAIVLYAKHRKRQRRERADVSVSVTRRGGYAAVRMPMGRSQ